MIATRTRDNRSSKEDADHGPGMRSARCGICAHFMKPNRCERVKGNIKPEMWCKYFKKTIDQKPD